MILTEDEARTKWCPEVRFVIGPPTATWQERAMDNRSGFSGNSVCIASGCMFWRWLGKSDRDKSAVGYCGKGGKP